MVGKLRNSQSVELEMEEGGDIRIVAEQVSEEELAYESVSWIISYE